MSVKDMQMQDNNSQTQSRKMTQSLLNSCKERKQNQSIAESQSFRNYNLFSMTNKFTASIEKQSARDETSPTQIMKDTDFWEKQQKRRLQTAGTRIERIRKSENEPNYMVNSNSRRIEMYVSQSQESHEDRNAYKLENNFAMTQDLCKAVNKKVDSSKPQSSAYQSEMRQHENCRGSDGEVLIEETYQRKKSNGPLAGSKVLADLLDRNYNSQPGRPSDCQNTFTLSGKKAIEHEASSGKEYSNEKLHTEYGCKTSSVQDTDA